MAMMIAVRLFGATLFDRMNKLRLIMIALVLLMLCLIALPNVSMLSFYYLLAVVYGGAMGIALPILNALIFSASAPALRGLNTNMALFAMDAAASSAERCQALVRLRWPADAEAGMYAGF